jgi:hypothetical protein
MIMTPKALRMYIAIFFLKYMSLNENCQGTNEGFHCSLTHKLEFIL